MTARGDSLGYSRNPGSNYYAGLTHQSTIDLDADDAARVSAFHSLWVGKAGGKLLRSSPPLTGASVLSASRLEPLVPFPLASPCRFSRSIRKPGRASRRLHAGCRSGSLRASPELIPEDGSPPGSDIAYSAFDASAAVRLRSPLSTMPAGIRSRRFRNAHHHGFWPQQLAVA